MRADHESRPSPGVGGHRNPQAHGAARPRLGACAALALPLLLAALSACGGGDPPEPAARVQVQETELRLPYPGSATLETAWRPLTPPGDGAGAPTVFVHLLDESGEILRTFDHPFPETWTQGESVSDPIRLWQSALAEPLSPGRYRLTMGLVGVEGDGRSTLVFEGTSPETIDRGEYAVATVTVEAGEQESRAEVEFVGPWKPTVPGGDRQVLATRMLGGAGGLTFRGIDRTLEVGMTLHIPTEEETGYRLVSEDEQGGAAVTVGSSCGSDPVRVAGPGDHEVRLVLRPQTEGGECTVRIDPRFALVDPVTLDRLTVQLQRLTWSPAAPEDPAPGPAPGPDA